MGTYFHGGQPPGRPPEKRIQRYSAWGTGDRAWRWKKVVHLQLRDGRGGAPSKALGGGSRRPAAQPALSKLGGQGDEESKASARFSTSGTRRMRVPRSHSAGLQEPPYEALSDILKRRQTVNKQQVNVLTHLGLSAPGGKS